MALRIASHILALPALSVAFAAQAGPPPSRIEAVLDLSTPEAAVRTYSEAYAEDDFLAVYFCLTPAARKAFAHKLARIALDDVVSAEVEGREQWRVLDGAFGPYEHASSNDELTNPLVSYDMFQSFEVVLWSADQLGIHAVDFQGPVTVDSVGEPVERNGVAEVAVDATDAVEGPVRFVLQESPSGRWRVLSIIARPGAPDEAVFLALEDEDAGASGR